MPKHTKSTLQQIHHGVEGWNARGGRGIRTRVQCDRTDLEATLGVAAHVRFKCIATNVTGGLKEKQDPSRVEETPNSMQHAYLQWYDYRRGGGVHRRIASKESRVQCWWSSQSEEQHARSCPHKSLTHWVSRASHWMVKLLRWWGVSLVVLHQTIVSYGGWFR